MTAAKHGPEDDCPSCYECPGCDGGSGGDVANPVLDCSRPGVVLIRCGDCNGTCFLCPNIDPELTR